ncbi:MAG: hypothetical protein ABIJ00_02540 [Candidatus Eisenbacteria bacterium]
MMWKGVLSEAELDGITARLPDVGLFQRQTSDLSPDIISVNMILAEGHPDSPLPEAAPCFINLGNALWASGYALYQCLAHGIYARGQPSPHPEIEARFFERHYADDVALRLYSGGEYLAGAIVHMLDITRRDLKQFRGRGRSQLDRVAGFLAEHKQGHPVTAAVSILTTIADWQDAVRYRNMWVHDQPPLIEGLGVQFRRGKRWKTSPDGSRILPLTGGDPPHYTIEELKRFVESGLRHLLDCSTACLACYLCALKKRGAAQ